MFTPRVHVKAIRFGGSDIASYVHMMVVIRIMIMLIEGLPKPASHPQTYDPNFEPQAAAAQTSISIPSPKPEAQNSAPCWGFGFKTDRKHAVAASSVSHAHPLQLPRWA